MTYVGVDLAWGERARTGLAEVDADGRLLAMASVRSDAEVDEWLFSREASPRVVAVDAPLIVPNDSGMRVCERLIGAAYGRYGAAAYPSNRGKHYFNPPRAEMLAARHGWSVDPAAPEIVGTRCIEVYPHAVLVGLFDLGRTLAYKKGSVGSRRASALQLLDLLEAVPTLHVEASPRWNEVRAHVDGATRPVDLDAVEDEIDAVICAHTAWLFENRAGELAIYGDVESGYIVAPPAPRHEPAARVRLSGGEPRQDLSALTQRLRAFADARDWHQFHTPKNLAMAIAGEAGELAAELQWIDGEASRDAIVDDEDLRGRVSQEMADVLIYLVRLGDVTGIDLIEAANIKVTINETRFPPSSDNEGGST